MVDLLLLAFIGGYVRGGWTTGFVRRLAGLVFLVVAFLLGAYLREPLGALIQSVFPDIPEGWTDTAGYGAAFGIVYVGLNVIVGNILRQTAVGGMPRATDRVLGAGLGAVEGIVLASVAIVILHTYATPGSTIEALANVAILPNLVQSIDSSTIGRFLEATTVPIVLKLLGPFLPADITQFVPATIPGGLPGFPLPGIPMTLPTPTPNR
jgi:uncharacterized membrane protein required for colicin V production